MPLDRNKMLRYQVLDRCFRDTSRLYTVTDLLECCNQEMRRYDYRTVSRRTIQKDIHDLQMEPYNVEFDPVLLGNYYYRYTDTTQNLSVLQLVNPNRDALLQTIETLREIYDDPENQNPQWQWILLTLQALADNRPIHANEQYVSFENNAAFAGNVNFAPLLECIINRHPATIVYKPFHHVESKEWNIHPYFLKQYNSRWFLFARIDGRDWDAGDSPVKNEITCFALDRISVIQPLNSAYQPSNIDFEKYFEDVIGPTVNDTMCTETVTLKISADRYPYVQSKPFSEKQHTSKNKDNSYTIKFPIKINNEFISILLSFGSDIEIIHPKYLRETIAQKALEMAEIYKK